MKIKRIQGLKNIHVAKINGNKYDTPIPITGAKELSLELSYEELKMYADDSIDFMDYIFSGGSGTMSVTGLSIEEYKLLFGATVDNGQVVVRSTDVAPEMALLFENDKIGVNGKRLYCIYAVKFAQPSIDSKTKEGSISDESISISFTVRELADGTIFRFADTDEDGASNLEDTWYTKVPGVEPAEKIKK